MENDVILVKLLFFAALAVFLFSKHREIAKVIEAMSKNFPGGGPTTPMHPPPADDSALLGRRASKKPTATSEELREAS